MEKASVLRKMLKKPGAIVVAGAHDAISAKLIEKAGFDAIWTSSFGISAAKLGAVDASILTMTENLETSRNINAAVGIPVIADCDDGYGNAINVMRTVAEFEKAGIAGICIEDNIFPKRCSFYPGVRRELVSLEEFCGKIRAAKKAQAGPDFVVIARTEALIAGWGKAEALKRAEAYAKAGADAVLIHSKATTPAEAIDCARSWSGACPLVVIPTRFPQGSVEEFKKAGFKIVIFANQALRASLKAMQETLEIIRCKEMAASVEDRIMPLEGVYDIVGVPELQAQEKEFLPVGTERVKAIIVAAGYEARLLPLIADRPKAMLDVKGKTLLERQVEALNACMVRDIVVVRGYQKEKITLPTLRYYDNDAYAETGEMASLFVAEKEMDGRFLFLYSDIIFDPAILQKLLKSKSDISLVVDRAWYDAYRTRAGKPPTPRDLVITKNPPRQRYRFLPSEDDDVVLSIGQKIPPGKAHGEFIGIALCSERGAKVLKEMYRAAISRKKKGRFHEAASPQKASFTDLIQEVIDQGHAVSCVNIYKGWLEIDTFEDYTRAWSAVPR